MRQKSMLLAVMFLHARQNRCLGLSLSLCVSLSLSLSLSRVQCSVAHKLWILRDICQMQHISFLLPSSFLRPSQSHTLLLTVKSILDSYPNTAPRLFPRGAPIFSFFTRPSSAP